MKYNLGIVSGYHEFPAIFEWYNIVSKQNKNCIVITPNINEYKRLKELKMHAVYIKDYFPKKTPNQRGIEEEFKKKGVSDLKEFCQTEKAYYFQPIKKTSKYAYKYLKAFEKIFDEYDIEKIYQSFGGEVIRRTAYIVGKEKGVITFFSAGENFIPNRTVVYSDEQKKLIYPREVETLDDEELKKILNDKILKKKIIEYNIPFNLYKKTSPLIKGIVLLYHGNRNIFVNYLAHKYKINIQHRIVSFLTKKHFSASDSSDKYFFYPFNVAAESELFVRNRKYSNQIDTVKNLSENLPDGHKLYVKLHPGVEGHLRLKEYKALSKMKNVKLVLTNENAYALIKNSLGVIIAASTVGLEAYVLRKPVCVMGNWPYKDFGNFIQCSDYSQVFDQLLNRKTENDPIRLLRNINSFSFKGGIYSDIENVEQFLKSLLSIEKEDIVS